MKLLNAISARKHVGNTQPARHLLAGSDPLQAAVMVTLTFGPSLALCRQAAYL